MCYVFTSLVVFGHHEQCSFMAILDFDRIFPLALLLKATCRIKNRPSSLVILCLNYFPFNNLEKLPYHDTYTVIKDNYPLVY